MIAPLLDELRARGIELHADGAKLRVLGPPGSYSSALRARLLANKADLLEHLRREDDRAAATYEREERAWASEYVRHMALANGYDHELARVASEVVGKAPACAPFRVERDVIMIAMGEGLEVRVHREPERCSHDRET